MTDAEVAMVCTVGVWLLAIAVGKSVVACRHHCSQRLSRLDIEAACSFQTSGPVHEACNWRILHTVLHSVACRHSSSTALWQRRRAKQHDLSK